MFRRKDRNSNLKDSLTPEELHVYAHGAKPLRLDPATGRYIDDGVPTHVNTRISHPSIGKTALQGRPLPPPTMMQAVQRNDQSLVASAQIVDPLDRTRANDAPVGGNNRSWAPSAQPWQRDALYATTTNETVAFAASTVEAMGRHIRFNIEKMNEKGAWTKEEEDYQEVLVALRDDSLSQEALVGTAVRLIFLAGEVYFAVYNRDDLPHLVSLSPVEVNGNQISRGSILGNHYDANGYSSLAIGGGVSGDSMRSGDAPSHLIRAFIRDDIDGKRATSNLRAAQSALCELTLIDDLSAALLVSRISGAGILLVPDESAFEDDTDDTSSYISKALTDAASIAIANPAEPEAHVPIVITASAELIEKWRMLDMNVQTEEKLLMLRESANKRVERAVDLPELIFNTQESNHWSLATSVEMASNYFVARAASTIAEALTMGLLIPSLPREDIGKYRIGVVLTGLISRARAVTDAIQLYDRNLIRDETMREIVGFSEIEKPENEEIGQRLLLKLALAQPQTFGPTLLEKYGINIMPALKEIKSIDQAAKVDAQAGRAIVKVGQDPTIREIVGEDPSQNDSTQNANQPPTPTK